VSLYRCKRNSALEISGGGEHLTNHETNKLFNQVTDDYSLMLLNWAYKKLGDKYMAEDLAQEVLLQIYSSVKRDHFANNQIEKLENYVWKIAHYVWCHYLRRNESYKMLISIDDMPFVDESDSADEYADNEEEKQLIAYMRQRISRLNYLQREIMISFYIDGNSIKQISEQLSISESAVKWHLFDTRKKLKKEITTMSNNDFIYRPRTLHVAASGQTVPVLDIKMIQNSLTKQNICIACYQAPKSLDDLSDMLGIPKVYIEDDLKWLVEKEFMCEVNGRYSTTFTIRTTQDEEEIRKIYFNHKEAFSHVIVDELMSAEDKIRKIGFAGCDKPMAKMLWWLIYRYNDYKRIPLSLEECPAPPIRPDGGKYFPLGFDRTDMQSIDMCIDISKWDANGSMCNDGFHWYGMYNFGKSVIEDVMDRYTEETQLLHAMLRECITGEVNLNGYDENGKYNLSKLVNDGFIRFENDIAYPNFYVFTAEQYKQLEETVFAPLTDKLSDELVAITNELRAYCKDKTPPQLKHYAGIFVKMALYNIGWITTVLAFNDGKLYDPKDKRDGEFLTFLFVE
jgi:RNA polymerase sigma factor (sigma-70 family)